MMIEFLLQFAVELLRALLIDELSRRVRGISRHSADMPRTIAGIHRRNRNRLLNRLFTELQEQA